MFLSSQQHLDCICDPLSLLSNSHIPPSPQPDPTLRKYTSVPSSSSIYTVLIQSYSHIGKNPSENFLELFLLLKCDVQRAIHLLNKTKDLYIHWWLAWTLYGDPRIMYGLYHELTTNNIQRTSGDIWVHVKAFGSHLLTQLAHQDFALLREHV
jgi:hypothetical protein